MVALCRDSVNRVLKTYVVPGQPSDWNVANSIQVLGTPYMGAPWNYEHARNYDNDRGATVNQFPMGGNGTYCPLYGLDSSQGLPHFSTSANMASGGTRPANAGSRTDAYVFFVDPVDHLYEANLWQFSGSAASDMGIITLPP